MTTAGQPLNKDQAYVSGRSEEQARDLIERAEEAGIDISEVITTSFGFIVPKSILKKGEATSEEQANVLPDAAPNEAEKSPEAQRADEAAAANANAGDAAEEADAEEAKAAERKTARSRKATDTEEGK